MQLGTRDRGTYGQHETFTPNPLVKMPLGDLLGGENPTTSFPWFLLATLAPPRKITVFFSLSLANSCW